MSDEMGDTQATQAVLTAVAQLGGQVTALSATVDKYASKVDDMRDRVIKMEAQNPLAEIAALRTDMAAMRTDIETLKTGRAQLVGAGTFATQIREWAPFIVALLGLAVFYFKH